jgi:hypothetical protein
MSGETLSLPSKLVFDFGLGRCNVGTSELFEICERPGSDSGRNKLAFSGVGSSSNTPPGVSGVNPSPPSSSDDARGGDRSGPRRFAKSSSCKTRKLKLRTCFPLDENRCGGGESKRPDGVVDADIMMELSVEDCSSWGRGDPGGDIR